MEYGIMMGISPREPIGRFAKLAKMAEDYGFGMAWVGDSQLIFKNTYVALTLAAKETGSIKLGPGVSPAGTRHFTELANAISAINEVSDGRAVLGFGVGDSSVTPLGLKAATIAELRQFIELIRDLCRGEEVLYGGTNVRLRPANDQVPIFVSASQPRMLRLAGAVADGVIILGGADVALTQWQLSHVEEGARESGRSLEDVFVDLYVGISISRDLEKARQEVRPYATSQARWFSRWKQLPDVLSGYAHEFQVAYDNYDFYYHVSRQGEHNQLISDSLVELIAIVGPEDKCAERVKQLTELKIDRISFLNLPGGREQHLRQLAEDLIPRVS